MHIYANIHPYIDTCSHILTHIHIYISTPHTYTMIKIFIECKTKTKGIEKQKRRKNEWQ